MVGVKPEIHAKLKKLQKTPYGEQTMSWVIADLLKLKEKVFEPNQSQSWRGNQENEDENDQTSQRTTEEKDSPLWLPQSGQLYYSYLLQMLFQVSGEKLRMRKRIRLNQIDIPKTFRERHVHPKFADYDRKSIQHQKTRIRKGISPIVDLTRKASGRYKIRDGWHRIIALKELGRKTVRANV